MEAVELLRDTLRYRTRDADPLGNAFTNLNLSRALQRAAHGTDRELLMQAIRCGEDGLESAHAAGSALLIGGSHHNLSCFLFDLSVLPDTAESDRRDHLRSAEMNSRASLVTLPDEAAFDRGRTRRHLAVVLAAGGEVQAAIAEYRGALADLEASGGAAWRRDVARELALLLQEQSRHTEAADAWEIAAEAGLAALDERAALNGRLEELAVHPTLFRFAAHAIASVGRFGRAAALLELGRARELGLKIWRSSANLEQLAYLNPDLEKRYRSALQAAETFDHARRVGLEVDPVEADRATTELRQLQVQIGHQPGVVPDAQAGNGVLPAIVAAATPGVPIAYLVAAPGGASTIVVSSDGAVRGLTTDAVDSARIVEAFLGPHPGRSGYLYAQTEDSDMIDECLAPFEDLIGSEILRPLSDLLSSIGAHGVCLVPTGILGHLPLHGLKWTDDKGASKSLIDDFEVLFAPSARVRRAAVARARSPIDRPRLVAVGNPLPNAVPLEGAEHEAEAVAAAFVGADSVVLLRDSASKQRVLRELPSATHVHPRVPRIGSAAGRTVHGLTRTCRRTRAVRSGTHGRGYQREACGRIRLPDRHLAELRGGG